MDIQRKGFEESNNVKPDWSFKFDVELQQYVALDFEMTNQVDEFNEHWDTFRAGWDAKAQAVPEGFVLAPKLLSDELADELASDAFNNIQSMFDYEHRGSTATHREEIRLRWCKNKARHFQENYKIVIEAQEQKG